MKKGLVFLMVTMIAALCVLAFVGVANGQEAEVPGSEMWVEFASNLMATLVVVLPIVSVILVKISAVMKKSAEVTEEYQQVQLAIAEAAADGNVDNDELAKIVARGRNAGVQSKELFVMVKEMISEAHGKLPKR